MQKPLFTLLTAVMLSISAALFASSDSHAVRLPDMSDSSANLFSQADEALIGRIAYQQLLRSGQILDDPLISHYISQLGRSLVSGQIERGGQYTFFIVDQPTINAFAMPGGYIGVNTGLLLASRNESELASVLAHEIAHVSQHHLARRYEQAQQLNLPLTAAVIAAIILGGSDPQLAQAAIYGSMAGSTQMQLDFSRAHEHEADRVGIHLLAESGHDPYTMASFFSRMQEEQRYRGAPPEFLSTHPVTLDRIAEAQQRAAHYNQRSRPSSLNYELTKGRLSALAAREPAQRLSRMGKDSSASGQYTQALLLEREGDDAQAGKLLDALHRQEPTRIAYIVGLSQNLLRREQPERARHLLESSLELHPANSILIGELATLLLHQGDANGAVQLLRSLLATTKPTPRHLALLADAEDQRGDEIAAALARCDYRLARGELHHARELLESLQRRVTDDDDDYYQPLIDARLKQLETELEHQREIEDRMS